MAKKKRKESKSSTAQQRDALEAELAQLRAELLKEREKRRKLAKRVAALESDSAASTGIDDLTKVTGIGRVIERRLQEAGVATYVQLSEMTTETQAKVMATLGSFEKRARPDQWVREARSFVTGNGSR